MSSGTGCAVIAAVTEWQGARRELRIERRDGVLF